MNIDIKKVIEDENNRLSYEAGERARTIIRQILSYQSQITASTKAIEELRAELKSLEVTVVDATSILG